MSAHHPAGEPDCPLGEPRPTDIDGTWIVRDPASGIIYSVVDGAVATTPDCRCWDLIDGTWVLNDPAAPDGTRPRHPGTGKRHG